MKLYPVHYLKNSVYKLIPDRLTYEQGKLPNILLFSSRRGGSTYLAEIITAEPGMRYIDQPFDLYKPDTVQGRIKSQYLPPMPMSQFISLTQPEAEAVEKYIRLTLSGGLRELSPPTFSKKNRTILKIVNALPLLDWLAEKFPVKVVYLIRHPIAQSVSVLRNGWDNTAGAYLQNEFFVQRFMTAQQHQKAVYLLERGSSLEKAVLNWVLENLVPLKYSKGIDLVVTYEELVLQNRAMIRLLCERLELHNVHGMQKLPNIPSASSGFSSESTIQAIASKDTSFLINKWITSLSHSEKRTIQDIFDFLEIDEYQAAASLPHLRLLHFLPPAEHPDHGRLP